MRPTIKIPKGPLVLSKPDGSPLSFHRWPIAVAYLSFIDNGSFTLWQSPTTRKIHIAQFPHQKEFHAKNPTKS